MTTANNSQAVTIFILGLLGLVSCQILSPVALIMGNNYLAECEAQGIEPDGLGKAGRILGIVGTVLLALTFLLVLLYVGLVGAVIAMDL
jgi:uncharacterized membrane protein YjgN (DUF898 family)